MRPGQRSSRWRCQPMSQRFRNFEFPKVFRPVAFSDFRSEYPAEPLNLWVNIPRAMFDDYRQIAKNLRDLVISVPDKGETQEQERTEQLEAVTARWMAWMGSVLFDPTDASGSGESLTAEDITRLADYCNDQDPQLWDWLVRRVIQEILDFRYAEKKGSSGRQRASSSADQPLMTGSAESGPPAGSTSSSEAPW